MSRPRLAFRTPPVTPTVRALLILIGVVFAAQVVVGAGFGPDAEFAYVDNWLALYTPNVLRGRVWQLLTYGFLHSTAAPLHILMNGLLLWWIGGPVEARLGSRAFRKLYVGALIAGGVAVVGVDLASRFAAGADPALVTGASGAISGLLAAFCYLHWDRWLTLFFVQLQGKHLLAAVVFIDVVRWVTSPISLPAHLGGMAFALLWMSGRWRPGAWVAMAKRARLKRKLRAVEGGRKGPPTLH